MLVGIGVVVVAIIATSAIMIKESLEESAE